MIVIARSTDRQNETTPTENTPFVLQIISKKKVHDKEAGCPDN